MIDPNDTLAGLGIKVSTLIAGFSGGLMYYYLEGSKKVEKSYIGRALDSFVSGVMGSLMAVYVAPLILHYWQVDPTAVEVQTGVGFLVGMTGIFIGHGIIRIMANWAKNPFIPGKFTPPNGDDK